MVRNNRKVRVGRVISNKMDKTVVVAIEWRQRHPVYKKSVRKITKLHAHDTENKCQIGDIVNVKVHTASAQTLIGNVTS